MRFSMTLDRLHKIVTGLVLLLIPAVIIGVMMGAAIDELEAARPMASVFLRGGLLFTAAIFVLTWAWAPSGAEVFGGTLRVERRAWPAFEIPLVEIERVEPPFELKLKAAGIRVFGDGGFFGSYGWFWNRQLGLYKLYTTQLGRGVVVHRRGAKPVVIVVDEPDRFYEALSQRV